MIKIKPLQLIRKPHFPAIRPLPTDPKKRKANIFKRIFRFLTTRRQFRIEIADVCWSDYLQAFIYLPETFVYDGASVPKLLNMIYSPTGVLFYGAGPHDFGYRYGGFILVNTDTLECYFKQCTKKEIDDVFNDLCAAESGMKKASYVATKTLTLAGIPTWRSWRKENRSSYKDFPSVYE